MGIVANTNKYRHNRLENVALPYVTNASSIDSRPHIVSGGNLLSTILGNIERRPGFSAYTADDYGTATISRWFTWQSWAGINYVFICVTDASSPFSKVYKQKVGTDATFQLIFTDSSTSEPFDFSISNNVVYFCNGVSMKKYDGATVNNWGISPQPTTAPTPTATGAGNVPNRIGHKYCYTYGVLATGYVSDISDLADIAGGAVSNSWSVVGPRCTDTQCDKVHIYRTEDGGATLLELSNSPIANPGAGTWTVTDNDADLSLQQSSAAPLAGVNSKPTPFKGVKFWNGRMWGFSGSSLYFSTLEENTSSVAEECFGYPPYTNVFKFGSEIRGLGRTRDFLLVYTISGIFKIGGDSLATFSRSTLSLNYGLFYRQLLTEGGDLNFWYDISGTTQTTDGYSISDTDLSMPIRNTIAAIPQASCALTYFTNGIYKWLVLAFFSRLFIFDFNLKQWMTPWTDANSALMTSVYCGQAVAGTSRLFIGSAKPSILSTSVFTDAGTQYACNMITGLFSLNTENPSELCDLEYVAVEGVALNGVSTGLSDVTILTDEDPAYIFATFTSLFADVTDPANRVQGTLLKEHWYWARKPGCQRVSISLTWSASSTNIRLLSLDPVYQVVR